jgi:excisionase family DNA binding protein
MSHKRQSDVVPLPEFLSVAEIAGSLNVAEPTVRRWLRAGDLPALKAGRAYRVRRDDFERWLTERRVD